MDGHLVDKAVAVSEMLARNVPIESHESVALVRALAAELMSTGATEPEFPELNQIDISSAGSLVLVGGRKTSEPLRRLGQLLQALLGQTRPPVQLRLLVSQATAPVPVFESIHDFDAALAYFERPNRTMVLQGVFERTKSIAPVTAMPDATLDMVVARKTSARGLALTAVAAVLIASSVGAYIYARRSGHITEPPRIVRIAEQALFKVEDVIVLGVSAVTERMGLGRIVFTDREPSPAPAEVASEPLAADKAPSPANRRSSTPVVAFDVDPHANTGTGVVDIEDADTGIYSPDSAGVTPPVGLRPQISRQLPADTSQLVPVEILVGRDGTVEFVKLVGPPRDIRESMLLSAIKAWRFTPAMKNGIPVKYRKTVWVPRE
jgi:hypothetical protein